MRIILASASPRRRELTEMLGLEITIIPAEGEERAPVGASPAEVVRALARAKCEEVAPRCAPGETCVAADTIVCLDGKILGKPHSKAEAREMLTALSGRAHEVYTGVAVCRDGALMTEAERTTVHFRDISEEEIAAYIATGEPMDKAGAYGAQGKGAVFVKGIEGDFFNVMGLPLCLLDRMLKAVGAGTILGFEPSEGVNAL